MFNTTITLPAYQWRTSASSPKFGLALTGLGHFEMMSTVHSYLRLPPNVYNLLAVLYVSRGRLISLLSS